MPDAPFAPRHLTAPEVAESTGPLLKRGEAGILQAQIDVLAAKANLEAAEATLKQQLDYQATLERHLGHAPTTEQQP
jgi:hypothetical protein